MTSIQQYNPRFNVDLHDLLKPNALQNMIKYNKEVVKFHLQCALDAYDAENSLRYLPNPVMYLPIASMHEVNKFLDLFRSNLDKYVDKLIRLIRCHPGEAAWAAIFTVDKAFSGVFTQLLHFTIMSCTLKLVHYSQLGIALVKLFMVECDADKENQFNRKPGCLKYLVHRTRKHCLYSICRNGIKSMSGVPGFQTSGATYGAGIYLAPPGVYKLSGDCVLYYATKNVRQAGSSSYVAQEEDVILRAILVIASSSVTSPDSTIIECIHKYLSSKK